MANHNSVNATVTGKLQSFICLPVYRSSVGKISKKVVKEKEKLISNRDSMLKKVEEIGGRRKAFKWLNDVEKAIYELEMLEKKIETGSSSLSNSRLIDHQTYWLYDEMIDKMSDLNSTYMGINTGYLGPFPPIEEFTSGYFLPFKSIKEASDQLLKALEDDSIHIIGLYGSRGSGKTTLAKAVQRISSSYRVEIFDKIVFATVSKDIDLWRIQAQIADSLYLKFNSLTKDGRAQTLSSALKSSTRILIILDDVWGKFELNDIGIPPLLGNCKVLLITPSQRVCTLMGCQREILLHPLSKDEAWTLFKYHSGINEELSSSDLIELAQEVALECEGLPGIITKVGSSLRSASIEVWKASLDNIKHSKAYNQIFLCFKGGDTGFSFTSFLYHGLCKKGLKTFKDDGELHAEDENPPSLIKAIEKSWLSIIILSENYAYSTQCLDELAKILECMKMKNQLVWPIFYKVEPSDIRYQRNSFGKAMDEHEERFGNDSEKIKKWRSALFEVSNLSGKAYKFGYEYEFIQKIIEDACQSYPKMIIG